MISRITMIAAAGVLLGAAMTPAKAADLGGGCCGDLEERIAELEATTARKGNRVVSLQIYGTVAKALMIVDNGDDSDAFVVDDDDITSIVGFKGESTIKPGLTAGFKLELGVTDASAGSANFENDEGDVGGPTIRHSYVYIESSQYGRFTIGQQSEASDGAAEISLANTLNSMSPSNGFGVEIAGAGLDDDGTALTLGDFASGLDGGRDDLIRYDSPSIYGFIVSASWGDDDYYDVSLRFAKEFNSIKIAAAVAYADSAETDTADGDFTQVIGSISVMHVPTGLFVNVAGGEREFDNGETPTQLAIQGGIERKWLPYGTTTVYGTYGEYSDFAETGSEATRLGLGAVQHIDSAAMDIFAKADFYEFEIDDESPEDLSVIMIGAKIDF